MIKPRADDVTEGKKKVAESEEKSGSCPFHFSSILNNFSKRIQKSAKIFLTVLAIFGALAVVEGALRIQGREKYDFSACQSLDRDFHHVMIPNSVCRFKTEEWDITYKINSLGLRDEEVDVKNYSKFRILLLGDSFAQGHGVQREDSFPEILEQILERQGASNFEVVNTGVFGYSPLVEYLYLAKRGLSMNADLIIVAVTLTDFFEDRQRFSELSVSYPDKTNGEIKELIATGEAKFNWGNINTGGTNTVKSKTPELIFKIKQYLRRNFKVYQRLTDVLKRLNQLEQPDILYQGDIDRDIVALIRGDKIKQDDWERLWDLPISHLTLMKELLDKVGVPLVVVGVPDAFDVSPREWPGRRGLAIPIDFNDPRGPWQKELEKRLAAVGIPYIDLLPEFKASGIYPLYFSNDGHFRESGHKLAAEIIFEKLQRDFKLVNL